MLLPYELSDTAKYLCWREKKMQGFSGQAAAATIDLQRGALSANELQAIARVLGKSNVVIYRLHTVGKDIRSSLIAMAKQLGLQQTDGNLCSDGDGISSISNTGAGKAGEYIPYTNKPLNWHTDGYYNPAEKQIRSIVMHCVKPATEGGDNAFLDHEMAYIALRDENPAYIKALMAPDVFLVPANVLNDEVIRPAQSGPVFSIDASGFLHMRFSARTRNIEWKKDKITRKAVDYLLNLLESSSPYILRYRLKANEGIISNNVLHNRSAFTDSDASKQSRLLLRARFFDRISISQEEI
ncbi:MAG: TauD/TfdA family dioxygenase [Gammaproteobacteria bacterium]